MATKRHDPTKHFLVVAGVTITGHDMDDWCSISKDTDDVESDLSGDGQVTMNKSVDNRRTLTLKLKENSDIRDTLDFTIDTFNSLDTFFPIVYTDKNIDRLYTSIECSLAKRPDKSAGSKNGTLEYKFLCADMKEQALGIAILQGSITALG